MSDDLGPQEFRGRCPAGARFATQCIYAGQEPDPVTGARTTPITMSTGFVFRDADDAAAKFALQAFGPIYTRITNPTADAVEKKIAALEGGHAALSTSCGHAAQALCFSNLLNPGDHFVSTDKLYGGSITQFQRQFAQFGWKVTLCGVDDFAGIEAAIGPKTKAVYCESIANPGGVVVDLRRLADIAHKHGIPLIVDNTTATPYLCRPFEHGADIIVHSATKGVGGHGNAMGGFIVEKGDFDWSSGKFPIISDACPEYNNVKIYETFGKDGPVADMFGTKGKTGMAFIIAARVLGLRDMGVCISPFNAFLISMGLETLPLRMQAVSDTALAVARFLKGHAEVKWVRHAALDTGSASYKLHQKYCPKGTGGLFTFGMKGGYDAGKKLVNTLKMVSLIANLGDNRTLVAHPASMMHSQLTPEQRQTAGAETETIRLSIGIEDAEDIIADLKQALDGVAKGGAEEEGADEFGGRCPPGARFATQCIHGGQEPDPVSGARTVPITMSTGFNFKNADDAASKFALQAFGPIYTRITNPTADAAEKKISVLEGGMAALAVSCGHAAQLLCFSNLMRPGDHFVATDKLYGGSVTQFQRQFKQFAWSVTFCGVEDYAGIEKAIGPKTKAVYCESIANPGGLLVDLRRLADIAHKHGIPLIVDNTTATPYLCRPFEHGADIIVHSATKALGGHGNAMGGFIVEKGDFDWSSGKFPVISEVCPEYNNIKIYETFGKDGPVADMFGTKGKTGLAFIIAARVLGLRDLGMCISPFNAFLISMGMETLPLRMRKHCANAQAVAEFLSKHPNVKWVRYAGLDPAGLPPAFAKSHELLRTYSPLGAGALFTFGLKGGYDAGKHLVNTLKMISLIANLGDTRTLVAHPASMMHSQLTPEQRAAAGAETETIRLSIGIEDVQDIISDLQQALDSIPGPASKASL